MMRDWYAVLGVPRTASRSEIRDAYHRRVRETHPDLDSARDGVEFGAVAEAYATLRDSARRAAYDRERLRVASPAPAPHVGEQFREAVREVVRGFRARCGPGRPGPLREEVRWVYGVRVTVRSR
jgi:curved DNA-binding protein